MAVNRLGSTGTTNNAVSLAANVKFVSRFQVGGSNFSFRRGAAIPHVGHATAKSRLVVYADSAGEPGALVAASNEVTGLPGDGVRVVYVFPATVTLTASAYYWIGVHVDTAVQFDVILSTGTNGSNSDTYSDGPADPFGTRTSSTSQIRAWLEDSITEAEVAKAYATAVLSHPTDRMSVPKAYALAVLGQETKVSVAKAYALAVLAEGAGTETSRPPILIAVT